MWTPNKVYGKPEVRFCIGGPQIFPEERLCAELSADHETTCVSTWNVGRTREALRAEELTCPGDPPHRPSQSRQRFRSCCCRPLPLSLAAMLAQSSPSSPATQLQIARHNACVSDKMSLARWNRAHRTNLTSALPTCRNYLKQASSEAKDKAIIILGGTVGRYGSIGTRRICGNH